MNPYMTLELYEKSEFVFSDRVLNITPKRGRPNGNAMFADLHNRVHPLARSIREIRICIRGEYIYDPGIKREIRIGFHRQYTYIYIYIYI